MIVHEADYETYYDLPEAAADVFYCFGAHVYAQFADEHLKKEITSSMQSKVDFYNRQLETEFAQIITMIKEFSTYDELGLFSNGSEILNAYEKREIVFKLQKGLSVIRSSSVYVEDASVYFPSIDRTILPATTA